MEPPEGWRKAAGFWRFGLAGGLHPVRRLVRRLEGWEPPRDRVGIWGPLILALLLLGAAGTFLAWIGAVLSPMAFDAPGAEKRALPWMILCGTLTLAVLCPLALVTGAILAWRRRFVTACTILAFPATVALAIWLWLLR
jgi:hypothetical protein